MPDGVYRELLAERLAARVGMPAAVLKKSFGDGPAARDAGLSSRDSSGARRNSDGPGHPSASRMEPEAQPRGRSSAGRGNLLSQAIMGVLHHPAAARSVKDRDILAGLTRPGISVLRELLDQATAMAEPSTGMLLERWRGRPEYGRLSELAMAQPMVTDTESAAKELQMAVEKLMEESGPGRRMDELLRKAEELGLNYDEKAELSSLLLAKGRPRAPT